MEFCAAFALLWPTLEGEQVPDKPPSRPKLSILRLLMSPALWWTGWARCSNASLEKVKILISLEQSRGALIYHLMGYEFLELYAINPNQLSSFRCLVDLLECASR